MRRMKTFIVAAVLAAFAGVANAEIKSQPVEYKAKVDWQLVGYGGAVHSFTMKEAGNDNSKGAAYNEKTDQRWREAFELARLQKCVFSLRPGNVLWASRPAEPSSWLRMLKTTLARRLPQESSRP